MDGLIPSRKILGNNKYNVSLQSYRAKFDKGGIYMTKKEIILELESLINRLDKADEYFRNLDLIEVDETKEWKLVKSIIKRASYLQGLLNEMEGGAM